MQKFIKRLLLVVGVLVVVLLAAVMLLGGPLIKQAINRAGPGLMKAPVSVEDVQLSVLRGHLRLRGLHVGNPEGFKTPSLFDMRTLEVDLDVFSLLQPTLRIRKILIEAPEITYERGLKTSNIGALQAQLSPPAAAAPEAERPASPAPAGGKKVVIEKLTITGAKVKASLTLLGGQALTLPLPPIAMTNIGGGEKNPQGVTLVSAINDILAAILSSVTQVVSGAAGLAADGVKALGSGVGKVGGAVTDGAGKVGGAVTEGAGKALRGATDLFRKKDAAAPATNAPAS